MEIPVAGKITRILFDCWGKQVYLQEFTDPRTKRVDEFLIFGVTPGTVLALILRITDDRKIVAIRQFRYGINRVIQHEIPGGVTKLGQDPRDVALRELDEETGYAITSLIPLGEAYPQDPGSERVEVYSYLGLGAHRVHPPKLEDTEKIEVVLVDLDRWIQMCMSGELDDPKSVMATMRALPYLGYQVERGMA